MKITVSGKQVDLSDALRTRVSDQLKLVAGKYFDHALDAHVTFGRARSFFTCDINLHAGRGLTLRHSMAPPPTSPPACAAIATA
jgi:ribosome-associated translation inhibitor RaiA